MSSFVHTTSFWNNLHQVYAQNPKYLKANQNWNENADHNLVVSLPGKTRVACELFRYQNYYKFRQTGSGHAADWKLSYTIQCSILMLCAKYQEDGLCGSWEKCDRNYFVTPTTTDSDPYMSPLRNAGDTINRHSKINLVIALSHQFVVFYVLL